MKVEDARLRVKKNNYAIGVITGNSSFLADSSSLGHALRGWLSKTLNCNFHDNSFGGIQEHLK
jgi:hypothetical protein